MDQYTEKHFQRWLDATIYADERALVEAQIRALLAYEPRYIETHMWSEMRSLAEIAYADLEV